MGGAPPAGGVFRPKYLPYPLLSTRPRSATIQTFLDKAPAFDAVPAPVSLDEANPVNTPAVVRDLAGLAVWRQVRPPSIIVSCVDKRGDGGRGA